MTLKNVRIAILVEQQYQEMEIWYPLYRLREAGAQVVTVGATAGTVYPSKLGYPCKADMSWEEAKASDFDGIVVPGGFAPDFMRRHAKAIDFVRDFDTQGKLVAAICHGPWMLCSANVLRGKHATSFFAIKDDVVNAGALWEDSEVVRDGNLVTARKPDDLPAFCLACIDVLAARGSRLAA
jgi:protease I